jgi:hypothetical protein
MRRGCEGLRPWKPGILRSGRCRFLKMNDRSDQSRRRGGPGGRSVSREQKNCKRSTSWRMPWISVQCRPSLPAEHFSFSRSLRSGLFGWRNGCGEQTPLTCENRPELRVACRSTGSMPADHSLRAIRVCTRKKPRINPRLCSYSDCCRLSQ